MKRVQLLLLAVLIIPIQARSQENSFNSAPWHNIASLDINLAFGPSATATWDPALGLRFQLNDHFRVGIGDVSFGSANLLSGTRYAIMAGPVVEFVSSISKDFSYSIFAGIPLQNRWGASITHTFGAAPYGAASLDYYFTDNFSFAGNFRLQYIITDAYLRSPRVLPTNALIAAFGLGFHFYF